MKKLELTILEKSKYKVRFMIQNQTHIGRDFGMNGNSYMAKNGIMLISAHTTALIPIRNIFYCKGTANCGCTELTCSPQFFKELNDAVEDYNQTFSAQ